MFLKGISKRWMANIIGIVGVILVIFIVIISLTVQSYAYNSVRQALIGRGDELLNVLSPGMTGYKTPAEFVAISRGYIENFPDKDSMEIMAVNRNGRILVSSTGFAPNNSQEMPDYIAALGSDSNLGEWVGILDTGEKVMAITRVVRDSEGTLVGSIRYLVSMEKADVQITRLVMTFISVGAVVMLFVTISGIFFIRSIVVPVRQVSNNAKKIALGDFDVRIEKIRNDEIGQLCDAINEMAAELGESEKVKNDFISSISHELRTPLTAIKGWAETLHGDSADKITNEKGMSVIIRESERLTGIVEELLDFSRIQSGRMVLMMEKMDISAELEEAVYMFTDRAKTEGKILRYMENNDLPLVEGDVNRMRQVFVNILDNALKYTEEGGEIFVSVRCEGEYVISTIRDTGYGIPSEHLANVKKKFYKANQNVRGSGIGLALADEIVALHSGSLTVESTEGIGTTVTIAIPTLKSTGKENTRNE